MSVFQGERLPVGLTAELLFSPSVPLSLSNELKIGNAFQDFCTVAVKTKVKMETIRTLPLMVIMRTE